MAVADHHRRPPTIHEPAPERVATPTAAPTFEAVFVAEYPRMVALAAAVTGRRDHAEEIAAEAMARLEASWTKVQGYESPGGWVRRVTINLAVSRKRRLVTESRAIVRLGNRPAPTIAATPAHDEPIWAAVAALPRRQRAVIALHYLEDRSITEIADICGISPATARVHLHRGRATLRDTLQRSESTKGRP